MEYDFNEKSAITDARVDLNDGFKTFNCTHLLLSLRRQMTHFIKVFRKEVF